MALFTDGAISTIEDLTAHDSGILEVASTEGIELSKKLELAEDELGLEVAALLPAGDSLANVVVTTPVRLWHAFRTLEAVYRDAYSNQLNDRFAHKRDQFAALGKWALDKLIESGVGVTGHPIAKAKPAELNFFPGPQSGATYYVCTAWVGSQGEEGAAGEWRALTVPEGNVLSVRAADPPPNAIGWNVFVGLSPETMTLQNDPAIRTGAAWLQEGPVSSGGRAPGTGQAPEQMRTVARILQRG